MQCIAVVRVVDCSKGALNQDDSEIEVRQLILINVWAIETKKLNHYVCESFFAEYKQ